MVRIVDTGEIGKVVFLGGGYYHIVEINDNDQREFGLHQLELVVTETNHEQNVSKDRPGES